VTYSKDGYDNRSTSIVVRAEEVAVAELELYRQTFGLSLPDDPGLTAGGTHTPGTGPGLYRLPEGRYELSGEAASGRVRVERVYPRQGLIDGLNVAIPIFLAFSSALTAGEILFPPEQPRDISPALVSSHILTLGLIGLDVALHEQKRRFLESLPPVGPPERHVSAAGLYRTAEAELAEGRIGAAMAAYSRIVTDCPDSRYTPHALYRIARAHQIRGDRRLAEAELEVLISDYPVADLYDRALKNLSDLYLGQGRYRAALERLDAMLLHDPLYSEEEIELRRGQILERWATEDAAGSANSE
jgi:tetratricopeptide (TPR) repeat protein